ncbi:hypothetical protein D9M71_688980 [compost metagenome]
MRRYISLQSLILVKSKEHDWVLTPSTAEDLASFGLRLLVAELGTEGARLFLRQKFAEYRPDYRGVGRDDRPAEKDRVKSHGGHSRY